MIKEVKAEKLVCFVVLLVKPQTTLRNIGPAEIYEAEARMDFAPSEGAPLNWPTLNQKVALVDRTMHESGQMQTSQQRPTLASFVQCQLLHVRLHSAVLQEYNRTHEFKFYSVARLLWKIEPVELRHDGPDWQRVLAWPNDVVSVPMFEEMLGKIHIIPCFVQKVLGMIFFVVVRYCQFTGDADFRGFWPRNTIVEVFTIWRVLQSRLETLE